MINQLQGQMEGNRKWPNGISRESVRPKFPAHFPAYFKATIVIIAALMAVIL